MEFVTTESFVSPLKGFLILPPATQEKKSATISCKLDDKPRLYVIGGIRRVNEKISNLELGLKRYDSSDVVIEEIGLKRQQAQRISRRVTRGSRGKERDQKVMHKLSGRGSEIDILITQGKIAQKKMVTEKDKLVELYQYPGYHKEEPTPLPNGIELDEILEKVIRAQGKSSVGKTRWAMKMLRTFLRAPCIQAILLDSFWWQFLHLYHPNREIQGYLFERVAENYSLILLGCHKVSNQEHILKFFPSLLSQAVYTCFCYCFPRSWFNTHEFKAQVCDVFSEWLGGCDISFSTYELSTVRKRPSRRRKRHASGTKSIKKAKKPVSRRKVQKQLPKQEKMHQFSRSVSSIVQPKEDSEQDLWKKRRSSQKKKIKIALLPRESHPACSGPEFTWHHLNIGGRSPLIQHVLQKRNAVPKAGCDIYLHRREICKPIPHSIQTYAEVIKQSFQSLRQRRKAFSKTYWRHWREMRIFDQQCKDSQEFFRQEMLEEMRRQAPKQKELLSFCPDGLNTSDKTLPQTPKVIFK
ncbi:protein FAM227A isoform X2 [Rhineura floridana]|uniref:protein FAM227A isoform X2 n=1 Tax=Rhineura floridana TaxID=261503 RepID=UPI002AC88B24|nr:protein FAM227A isoform X2 [Rhineura floridana]